MHNISLRMKISYIMILIGVVTACFFAFFMYQRNISEAHKDARENADNLLSRTVQMFMVSTTRFHEDFLRTKEILMNEKRFWMIGTERFLPWIRQLFMTMEWINPECG